MHSCKHNTHLCRYNFVAALEQHNIDGDFSLFLKVLFTDVHEKHYYDQMMMLSNLKAHLSKLDTLDGSGPCDGMIDNKIFFDGVRSFFPAKQAAFQKELYLIAMRDAFIDGEVHVECVIMISSIVIPIVVCA